MFSFGQASNTSLAGSFHSRYATHQQGFYTIRLGKHPHTERVTPPIPLQAASSWLRLPWVLHWIIPFMGSKPLVVDGSHSPMANTDCLAAQAEIQSILPLTLLNYYQWQHCLTLPLRCAYESFNFWVGGSSISSSRSNHGRSNHGRSINSIPEANCDKRQQRVLAPGAGTIIQHGWLANYISLVANAFKTSCLGR